MKKSLLLILLIVLAAASLSAYDEAGGSRTNGSTAGLFQEPFDLFTNVTDYSDLDSSVLFLDFRSPFENNYSIQAGTGYWMSETLYLATNIDTSLNNTAADIFDQAGSSSTVITDGLGNVTSYVVEEENSRYVRQHGDTDWVAFGGLVLAGNNIGIKNTLSLSNDSIEGTYSADTFAAFGTFSTGFSGVSALNYDLIDNEVGIDSIGTSSMINVTNASGTNTATNADLIGEDGFDHNSSFMETLEAGTSMAMGPGILKPSILIGFGIEDNSEGASEESYITNYNTLLPNYQGVSNAEDYNSVEVDVIDKKTVIQAGLAADYTYPLSERLDLNAGLGYSLDMDSYSQPISRTASATNYSATVLTRDTETFDFKWENAVSGAMTHNIVIPVGLTYKAEEGFNIALSYAADLEMGGRTDSFSGSYIQTQTSTTDLGLVSESTTVTTNTENFMGAEVQTNTLNLTHHFNVAAQFPLGERMRLNLGTVAEISSINQTKTTVNGQGEREYETVTQVDSNVPTTDYDYDLSTASPVQPSDNLEQTYDTMTIVYQLGLTYTLNEKVTFDLKKNTVASNLFDLSGWNLMVTVKY